jgi:hypothetical protein
VWQTTPSIRYSIYAKIKRRLKLENACYHLKQNIVSFSTLHKNMKIKIKRTIILLVLLFCCETWSLTLRMEQSQRFIENWMLRKMFGPDTDEVNRKRRIYN